MAVVEHVCHVVKGGKLVASCVRALSMCRESGRKRSGRETFFMGSDSEDDHETAPEKKLRLAKEYLAQLEQTGDERNQVRLFSVILCGSMEVYM